ncbi:HEAT repeat protein-like protein [Xylogone sp. PMI_703]|nr:HEAT repeat protein-like protein [Xylogone sp. PMI_703]
MPVASSGRIIKIRKGKTGTSHTKNHRWESFTTKVAKLHALDPVRRVRRHGLDIEDISTNVSYFKAGLEKWQELNMSADFACFLPKVLPHCDSLPQILHFEQEIMDAMVNHIEKKEKESLEPLLELMTDFAHDLGFRFERHYPKTLEILVSIVASPQDVEVIEWSFTCLTFLFKYLSRLLVPDIRPTYDLIAPLLGKTKQQPHIARFAAEALSFLIKKAGASSNREKSLPLIVEHIQRDLQRMLDAKHFGLYYHGVMTLFAEAMKGSSFSVHSAGPAIYKSLLSTFTEECETSKFQDTWMNVLCGILTSIIHHTNAETFKDIQDIVLEQANIAVDSFEGSQSDYGWYSILLSARLIGVMAGVRKGTRISQWPALLRALSRILLCIQKNGSGHIRHAADGHFWDSVLLSVSITLQYAPMDAVIPFVSGFMDALTRDPLAPLFLTFCSYLCRADTQRFRSIVLPYFKRFIVAHWSDADNGDTLCVLLPSMVVSGVLPSPQAKDAFNLPQSWQDQMVSKFERLELSPFPEQASVAVYNRSVETWHDRCLPKYNALLDVLECTSVHPSTNARIAEILHRKLKLALRPSSSLAPEEANFIVGRGFSAFTRMSTGVGELDKSLEPLLLAAAPRYTRLPHFLEALLFYENAIYPAQPIASERGANYHEPESRFAGLIPSLIDNLATDSHDLRFISLRLLEYIHIADKCCVSETLSTMMIIEQLPLDLQNARSASMHIRKLASLYSHESAHSWLRQAIPSFCFGLLNVRFAQIWEDATVALKQISEVKSGEEAIARISFNWLESTPPVSENRFVQTTKSLERNDGLTDFECSNLNGLYELGFNARSEVSGARDIMLNKFENVQRLIHPLPPAARSKALRVLSAVPQVAEKRSRQLVPMFLSWARRAEPDTDVSDEKLEDSIGHFSRNDQKAQLELFGLFLNPKSLYRAEEVKSTLLGLLGNGDVEIQRAALKAIFSWKNSGVKLYEENLLNLLDDARFKDEITVLLNGDSLIQPNHRPDVMPLLLRILYGRTITRKGIASGRQGMEARRLIVLRSLKAEDIGSFLDIALGPLKGVKLAGKNSTVQEVLAREILSVRKQMGFINMMESVLKDIGTNVLPFAEQLANAVLYCLTYASTKLRIETEEPADDADTVSQASMLKVIRQTGLKCMVLLFSNAPDLNWTEYVPLLTDEIITPRLENLPIETSQGISGLLQLFSVWASSPKTVRFLGSNSNILQKVVECLVPEKSKDEVKIFALNIIRKVANVARDEKDNTTGADARNVLLTPNMDHFLVNIGQTLRNHQDMHKELLEACVETISELAPFVSSSPQAHNLVDVSVFLLNQPSRRISPKTKGGLLLILEHFVPLYNFQDDVELKDKVYDTISALFGFFKDKTSREVLSRVLLVYARKDPIIGDVAQLCIDLNSFVDKSLDLPDYDRRLKAFTTIISPSRLCFTAQQWKPMLYNMLYYIKFDEEFGILSSNSSECICQFIETASGVIDLEERQRFIGMFSGILLPALFSGAREPSEVIRREYLKVMAHLVRKFPEWEQVSDMHVLLAGDDELESSFFNNILSAGKGRQFSALALLSSATHEGQLSDKNISHFIIPMLEHFIFDRAEGSEGHNLAAETTTTIGNLATSLGWPQYRAILRRYIGYIESKPELGKQVIRLLGKFIDTLAAAVEPPPEQSTIQKRLASTIPNREKLADDLMSNILPSLTSYLHNKDEATVSLRVPVAIIVVRLLKLLPSKQLDERLPSILTDICHILRSKAPESRDMTRDTLAQICVLLGPSCFGFVLKELRGALSRGYQLHVLSYTLHYLLVATADSYVPGDLNYCLPTIVAIIMDDIFGVTGQEKDAEEYTSKMKEVKSSKSHDSMELIARTTTLSYLADLVRPIRVLLKEKLDLKMVRKIDELLTRISAGLLKNSAAQNRDSLIFCYEVIQEVYKNDTPQDKSKEDWRLKRYIVQGAAKKSGERGSTTFYTYKLVRFALDILRSLVKKHEHLRTGANLVGFLPILGDAVVQGEEEIKIAAFKLLTTIVRVPMKASNDGTNLYRVATTEAAKLISQSSSATSNSAQAALRLVGAVLRDRPDVHAKETSIDQTITKLKDYLTEPEHRHVTFNFLRAVLDSKLETATVYDTLDHVGTIMITNDDKDTRDLARGAYLQFLREYPQRKSRWSKQLSFIVANLQYDREGGRLSILEVIHILLLKSSEDYVQEVSATCFVPLVFVLINDESEKCRMAAAEVIKEIFRRADEERLNNFMTLLRSWLNQTENPSVLRLALQAYGLYFECQTNEQVDLDILQVRILDILASLVRTETDWELAYAALQLSLVLCRSFPLTMLGSESEPFWNRLRACLSYPHAWVKHAASKLMGIYFGDFARQTPEFNMQRLPLTGSGGLKLKGHDIQDLIPRITTMLRSPALSQELADEIVKNLAFLGQCAGFNQLLCRISEDQESDIEDDLQTSEVKERTIVQYLFSKISSILRREVSPPRAPGLIPKFAAMQILQILCDRLPVDTLLPTLEHILLPLHNLTDPSIPTPYSTDELFRNGYENLKSNSEDIMRSLQTKFGTTVYTQKLLKVRENVKERRMHRSSKRKIEAIAQPEKYGKDKKRKGEKKKEKRKERSLEHRDKRRGY